MENYKKGLLVWVIGALVLYALSFGVTYGIVKYAYGSNGKELSSPSPSQNPSQSNSGSDDEVGVKDTPSPLNGSLHTKAIAAKWENRRPLAVMIENHTDARPQSGLSRADVVYEAVAEGGITRFMAVFYSRDADLIGPVRSARTYYLDWVSEYDPLYAHVGGANTPGPANALGQIRDYGIKDMDQFGIGFPTYWRDYERLPNVATEHTMYSSTDKLWKKGAERGWGAVDGKTGKSWEDTFTKWLFKEDVAKEQRVASASASFGFWKGYDQFAVKWVYDSETNSYKRFNGGASHVDKNNGQQLTAKNIVIQFMSERNAFDGYENNVHLLYGTIGKGKAMILQDGKVINGEWRKADRKTRTRYFDTAGTEIKFNRGQIWIETLPIGNQVTVE